MGNSAAFTAAAHTFAGTPRHMRFAEVLVARGYAAAYVALRQVFVEHGADAFIQFYVYRAQAFGHVLVHARLARFKVVCARAHGGARADYVLRLLYRPLGDIVPGIAFRHIIPPIFSGIKIICRNLPLYDGFAAAGYI